MQCKDMTYGKAETLETKKQQCTHLKFNSKFTPEKLPGPNMGTQKEQALVFGGNFDPSLPVIPPEVWCFRYVFGVQIPLHQLGRHVFFGNSYATQCIPEYNFLNMRHDLFPHNLKRTVVNHHLNDKHHQTSSSTTTRLWTKNCHNLPTSTKTTINHHQKYPSGHIKIFHQSRFLWNKAISLY